jgi:hypothetical protein
VDFAAKYSAYGLHFDEQYPQVKGLSGKRLTSLKMQTLTVTWAKRPGTYRLIAFWDRRKSCPRYMNTHSKRRQFNATQIIELYSLNLINDSLLGTDKPLMRALGNLIYLLIGKGAITT